MLVWITKGMTNAEQEALAVWPPPASSNHVGGNWFPDGGGQRLKTVGDKLYARISCPLLRRYPANPKRKTSQFVCGQKILRYDETERDYTREAFAIELAIFCEHSIWSICEPVDKVHIELSRTTTLMNAQLTVTYLCLTAPIDGLKARQ